MEEKSERGRTRMKRRKSDAWDKKAGMREGEEVEKRWERKKVK